MGVGILSLLPVMHTIRRGSQTRSYLCLASPPPYSTPCEANLGGTKSSIALCSTDQTISRHDSRAVGCL